jgi:hypothetical protein
MPTYTKIKFSASDSYNSPILEESYITENSTQIHTSSSTSGVMDEVWLWVFNSGENPYTVNISLADGPIIVNRVEPKTTSLILPGIPLMGGGELYFRSPDAPDDYISAMGYVNRITP